MGRLQHKIAIVTGGSQGQGEAISRAFVAEGAQVVIADIAVEAGEALAAELGENAAFVRHDVAEADSWRQLLVATEERFGAVNVLANNAGILRFGAVDEMSIEEAELVWNVNQRGCWLGMQAVIPTMKAHGGGSIINSSSIEGLAGMGHVSAYCGSKWAVRGMTKAVAHEVGGSGIRVNSIHPGMIDTPMTQVHGGDAAMAFGASKVALKRVGVPADIAPAYVYLASDESAYVTGAELAIDGGATATHAFGG